MVEGQEIRALVAGNGAREHTFLWKLIKSPKVSRLYSTLGNAGINQIATPLDCDPEDIEKMIQLCADYGINFVMSGPEGPYAAGLVDQFTEAFKNKPEEERPIVFGPTQAAARIESSKIWSAQFNSRWGIPQPDYIFGHTPNEVKTKIWTKRWPGFAVKADELDGGKGVTVVNSLAYANLAIDNFMIEHIHGPKVGNAMLVQEKLEGQELTVMALVDRQGNYALFPPSVDYKALNGKNTGGMGAFAPARVAIPRDWDTIHRDILQRAIHGMKEGGCSFSGILYAGIMLTEDGPKVLEWNCRGGDPEIEATLPLFRDDFDLLDSLISCVGGRLIRNQFLYRSGLSCIAVVLASKGYPDKPETEKVIEGLDKDFGPNVLLFHGGTEKRGKDIFTTGGRVLTITATATLFREAKQLALSAANDIHFDGIQYRRDIAENI